MGDDDKLYKHEALHACHMIEGMFELHVLESEFVQENNDLFCLSVKVSRMIADLYQEIGKAADA